MSQFKVGDRVRRTNGDCYKGIADDNEFCEGETGVIVRTYGIYSDVLVDGKGINTRNGYTNIELISNSTSMQNITEKFTTLFKSEPEKSFRKAGITNGDDLLTEDGQTIFLSYLLKKNGEDFKKEVVDPILAEEKA